MSIYRDNVRVSRIGALGGGEWKLEGLTDVTVLFGKNGSGKSLLLRGLRDQNVAGVHYVAPERTGELTFKASYMQQQLEAQGRRDVSSRNFVPQYREQVISRIQAYFLRRGEIRQGSPPGHPSELEELLSQLVPDFSVADRIEIRSYGRLPTGITVDQLSGRHDSKPTNPLIAGAFHRTGAVEVWGRGTNRVIAMRKKHGAPPPAFEERSGFLIVTFKARLVAEGSARAESQVESKVESRVESAGGLEDRIAAAARRGPLSKSEIAVAVGKQKVDGQLHSVVRQMLQKGLIEYTLPDKPNSRLQKYRLSPAGEKALKERAGDDSK